jgi:LacI family transcriptional regulator
VQADPDTIQSPASTRATTSTSTSTAAAPAFRIALLLDPNHGFERDIATGVAEYMRGQRVEWHLVMEEDYRAHLDAIARWDGDGIIANFDNPGVAQALASCRARVVAVGGSHGERSRYPEHVPYVACDHDALVRTAYHHLIDAGLTRFAMFSETDVSGRRWAVEREQAFERCLRRDRGEALIYRGLDGQASNWSRGMEVLADWLRSLPKPIGIIAVNDVRARQLLQARAAAGVDVTDVAIIGIDNDASAHLLTHLPLASVTPGTEEMGRNAASLLHRMLLGRPVERGPHLSGPARTHALAALSQGEARHPQVMRALYFIRQHARRGIKAEQVADYVGVSRSSLDGHFRRERGNSVHDEILRFKLEEAKRYLARGDWKIADVALRCGFTSVQYLYTVFSRELGCTPRAWQEQAGMRMLAEAA